MSRPELRCLAVALALLASVAESTAEAPGEAEIRALLVAGETSEAVAAARAAVEQLEGSSGPALADGMDLLVEGLIASRRAAEQETAEMAERAVEARRAVGDGGPALAVSLARLGEVLIARQELDRAAEVLTEAEGLVGGDDLGARALVLNRLGALRQAQGELSEAARLYADALTTLDDRLPGDEAERDRALAGLGDASYGVRDFAAARRAYQQLLEGRIATSRSDSAAVGEAYYRLANATAKLGDGAAAEQLYRQAIATFEAAFGPDHLQIALATNNGAIAARRRGDYLEARRLFERSLAIFEGNLGPDHPYVAGTLNNLGTVLLNLGDLSAARVAYERALAIREQGEGSGSLAVAQTVNNLGSLLLEEGDAAGAVSMFDRALAIREQALGGEAPAVGLTLGNLGDALRRDGRLAEAERTLRRAVAVMERFPDQSWVLANILNNLGLVLLQQERLEESTRTLAQAREICEASLGHGHPLTVTVSFNQAKPAAFLGRVGPALGLTLEAARTGREHLRLTSAGLSERAALGFAAQHQRVLDLALSLASEPALDDPTLIAETWDAVIRSRGLILDEMIARRRLLPSHSPQAAKLFDELETAASRLSSLLVEGAYPEPGDEVETAREDLERAERTLGEASPPFARERVRGQLGLEEVSASVPAGSALVAYVRFNRRFTQDSLRRHEAQRPWYLAFVRTPYGEVEVLPLSESDPVDRLVGEWRRAASRPARSDGAALEAGSQLRRLIWDPVAARLDGAPQVFVVPDGELGLVNLAALPIGPDRFLVEARSLIVALEQERDLVPDPLETTAGPCLLALGAPDFGAPPVGVGEPRWTSEGAVPASRAAPRGLADLRFAPLPATAAETAAVAALWEEAEPGHHALGLTGVEATEEAFKALAPGFRVLHLATHGFFLGGGPHQAAATERGVGALVPEGSQPADASGDSGLRLSGLALAGANRRDAAAAEDGILTAEEIATLDLAGVEWAVLSACESGVGEVSNREGVFGLRRAFRIAGARTVIMSLWVVDDRAAQEWMAVLYHARLIDRMSTAEAVREASLEVLAARRARGESVHPATWAAFVASGDWR